MKHRIWLFMAAATLFTGPVLAQDYVINVNGIVCEFCSYGVTKKIAKLDFIDHSKYSNGVKVEIQNQMVTIAVKEGASLDKEALFDAIRSGGYDPVEIFELRPDGQRIALAP